MIFDRKEQKPAFGTENKPEQGQTKSCRGAGMVGSPPEGWWPREVLVPGHSWAALVLVSQRLPWAAASMGLALNQAMSWRERGCRFSSNYFLPFSQDSWLCHEKSKSFPKT